MGCIDAVRRIPGGVGTSMTTGPTRRALAPSWIQKAGVLLRGRLAWSSVLRRRAQVQRTASPLAQHEVCEAIRQGAGSSLVAMPSGRHPRSAHAARRSGGSPSRSREEAGALHRVCTTIATEFAQPLTGILIYSELLLRQSEHLEDPHQRELSGLREGALQMDRLLSTLRDVLAATTAVADSDQIAREIALALTHPRPRIVINAV